MNEGTKINTSILTELAEMKRVYSALEAAMPHREHVSIAITSAEKGEGKTTMLIGLAALAAKKNGKRVLAIDLNWHAPSLHTLFGAELLDPEKVQNGTSIDKIVHHVPESNLDILPAVKEMQLEELGNGGEETLAEKLLNKAREAYDLVFIDTSKMFPTNRNMIDPLVIAQKADGVALVIASSKTSRQVVKRAHFALETVKAPIMGVIINDWQNPLS
jgi:protein-tyrosine kinase